MLVPTRRIHFVGVGGIGMSAIAEVVARAAEERAWSGGRLTERMAVSAPGQDGRQGGSSADTLSHAAGAMVERVPDLAKRAA